MKGNVKAAIGKLALFVISTVLIFSILVRLDAIRQFAYLVEKGRIQAARESMPTAAELDHWNYRARSVAVTVAPAVVQVVTERYLDLGERTKMDALRELLDPKDGKKNDEAKKHGTNGPVVPNDDTHRAFLEKRELKIPDGYGSGFIVNADHGYIVTNNHVIDHADAIRVYLADGRRFDADVLGADPKTDLAVLHIQAKQLHELAMADSGTVEVGDDVMAVGNPFGLDGTFSRGIISAKGRSTINIQGIEYKGFLQTDAVINPGNSGGPLVNMRGEVIAVNTAIATETGHYDGVGFAIPSRRVIQLLPTLVRGETVVRGYLGVSIVSAAENERQSQSLGWREYYGVIVRDVLPNTPAEKFGLRPDDIILTINGKKLRGTADLIDIIGETKPGTEATLEIWRENAKMVLAVQVARQPKNFSTRMTRPRK